MLPANMTREVRNKYGKNVSKHLLNFLTILHLEAKHKDFTACFYIETLIDKLKLDNYRKTRQTKRAIEYIKNDIEKAIELDYITEYTQLNDYKGDKFIFKLNKEKFYSGYSTIKTIDVKKEK